MRPLRQGIRRLFRLGTLRPRDTKREVADEIRLHIAMRAAQLVRAGMDPASADREAERLFARHDATMCELYTTAAERDRIMRTRERLESIMLDVRHAVRALRREPVLALFVVITLALGIGANVTSFTLLDRLLLRGPAHVAEPDRLLRLHRRLASGPAGEQTAPWIPHATYVQLHDGMRSVQSLAYYRVDDMLVGRGLGARQLRVGRASPDFFPMLGVSPLRGRFFDAGEDSGTAGRLAVLGESLWRSEFGGRSDAIGGQVTIADVPHTIIGVAPSGFTGPDVRRVDAWALAGPDQAASVNWHVVGRLRPGASLDHASADAHAVHRRSAGASPQWIRDATLLATPVHIVDAGREPVETTMARWLAAVSAVILVIAFANVVNLLLARAVRRRRELAIRVALGSGRGRVIRLLATEGVLLALLSGAASLLVASIAEPVVRRALFGDAAGWSFSLGDLRVLGTAMAIVGITAIVVGIVPAFQAGNPRFTAILRSNAQGGSGGSGARVVLTVAQASLSVLLLVGAGLFVRSLARVHSIDLGLEPDRVITAVAQPAASVVPTPEALRAAAAAEVDRYRRYANAVRMLPGVEDAAVSVGLPFDGGSFSSSLWVPALDSIPALPGGGPYISAVGTGYFETIGTPVRRGRAFTDGDREGSAPVAIVGETMARTVWPGRDPIGECFRIGSATAPCARVVGVAADVHRVALREEPSLQLYIPLGQHRGFSGATLLVRPRESSAVSWTVLRETIVDAEPSIRSLELRPLAAALDGEMQPLRLGLVTFGASGALALIVAALGLYSLMAYTVAWRTREIGVRLALGATAGRIARHVVGGAVVLSSAGIAIGLLLAVVGARWLEPHLFDTRALDPLVFAAVPGVLLAVALFAGWMPARRAGRISPTEALRAD